MRSARDDLARTIVRVYHSHGIPARVDRGLVLVHRDGELSSPLRPDLVALDLRADIERVKREVRAKLERYGVIDYVMNADDGQIERKFEHLIMLKHLIESNQTGEVQAFFRPECAILVPLLADADFAAHPFYWTVAWVVVRELVDDGRGGAIGGHDVSF
jgi:hypothetical protein